MLPKNEEKLLFFPVFIWLMHYLAIADSIESISSLVGFPSNSRIL